MLINFLNPNLNPKVDCSCVTEDDYTEANLIAEQSKGFISFKVTKPPIDITFKFQHPIEIKNIKIWPAILSLRSTGFEVYALHENQEIKIGKIDNVTSANLIDFQTEQTKDSSLLSDANLKVNFFTYFHARKAIRSSDTIKIRITSTKKCAPVLRRIEIWGYSARETSKEVKDQILKLWEKSVIKTPDHFAEKNLEKQNEKETGGGILDTNEEDTPEEFLDPLTFNLMVFPMTLPSGKTIDQSTIDKFLITEESYGRPPSDPFTGLPFTNEKKPIFNNTLKGQIDQFLIKNQNRQDLKKIPRTLHSNFSKRMIDHHQTGYRRDSLLSSNTGNFSKKIKLSSELAAPSSTSLSTVNLPALSSLDQAVKNALQKLRSRGTGNSSEQVRKTICHKCNLSSNQNFWYKISKCDHIVCRKCLHEHRLPDDTWKCPCGQDFRGCDIEKFYTIN